jgi:hypothetical protein
VMELMKETLSVEMMGLQKEYSKAAQLVSY